MGWRGSFLISAPVVLIAIVGALLAHRDGHATSRVLWLLVGLGGGALVPLLAARMSAHRSPGRDSQAPPPAPPDEGAVEAQQAPREAAELVALRRKLAEAEAHAQQMSQEKAGFLARVNHELRTPLNGVVGVIELLRNQRFPDAEREQYLDTAYVSCRHVMRIINDNLDLARIDDGELALRHNRFRVRDCVEAVQQMMAVSMREKALRFECDVNDRVPPEVMGDRDRLMQVLVNLVENAHKYTQAGGEVSLFVSVKQAPDGAPARAVESGDGSGSADQIVLHFAVEDTGIGIRRESHENIFEAYAQAQEAGANVREGSGLGLAICARLVELMGGEIGVESEFGEGSQFWFTVRLGRVVVEPAVGLPVGLSGPDRGARPSPTNGAANDARGGVTRAQLNVASGPPVAAGTVLGGADSNESWRVTIADSGLLAPQGLKVLLVDDNLINRKVAERLLALDRHLVTSIENGQLALEAVRRDQFDVVLMDIHMPVMDGHEATRRIRANERGSDEHMPIIAITASSLSEEVERIFESGMDDVVSKPVTLDSLRAALAHIEHVQ